MGRPSMGWVGLGPVVKFSKNARKEISPLILLSPTSDHDSRQSGSSRASGVVDDGNFNRFSLFVNFSDNAAESKMRNQKCRTTLILTVASRGPPCDSTAFYRAMHYSAKRDLAIACRLSVCPSVTLVDRDHIGWKSWKLIARTISPTPSLFVVQRPSTYSQGNMGKFWKD